MIYICFLYVSSLEELFLVHKVDVVLKGDVTDTIGMVHEVVVTYTFNVVHSHAFIVHMIVLVDITRLVFKVYEVFDVIFLDGVV